MLEIFSLVNFPELSSLPSVYSTPDSHYVLCQNPPLKADSDFRIIFNELFPRVSPYELPLALSESVVNEIGPLVESYSVITDDCFFLL